MRPPSTNKKNPFSFFSENFDRFTCHLLQARVRSVFIKCILHMTHVKQSQDVIHFRSVQRHQGLLGGHEGSTFAALQPRLRQVLSILEGPRLVSELWDPHVAGKELLPPSSHHHIYFRSSGSFDELLGNIHALLRVLLGLGHICITLPVPHGGVGVGPRRRGVRHPRGRHHASGSARVLEVPKDRGGEVLLVVHGIAVFHLYVGVDTNGLLVGLDAAEVSGGAGGRVRRLHVGVVRLDDRGVGEGLIGHDFPLVVPGTLPLEDPCRC